MSENLESTGQSFLAYLDEWMSALPEKTLEQAAPVPGEAAVISVDLVNGFCSVGPLASPRVNDIVPACVALFKRAWARGIRHIVLAQDTHEPDALEFEAWPPHCVRGTQESEAVDAIRALPFYAEMTTIKKNSIHSWLNTSLAAWMEDHPEIQTYIVVGDCTDLCVYQMAMHLRLEANAKHIQRRVIVPANCVATYDYPVDIARQQGALPHPGDFLHATFLYHMALNGIEIVSKIL
ncbi:amidases related to nicotinamidase [Longilinea arvoryzae]|uniref:Amidases related to nicotinamidase n=1 Tax=Longilinea arvoryzae TaxID=360412 RepID=A0A0S7BCQ5_9CHLR|nr:isochorismatase family cysteine hydrolase [Longilinea arvoryzae]GAP15543.1 amidases related to nicotinamidase [Longilinea arvoryzae]